MNTLYFDDLVWEDITGPLLRGSTDIPFESALGTGAVIAACHDYDPPEQIVEQGGTAYLIFGTKRAERLNVTVDAVRQAFARYPQEQRPLAEVVTVTSTIERFNRNPESWRLFARRDFEMMAAGASLPEIREKYYPGWVDADFKAVLVALEESDHE